MPAFFDLCFFRERKCYTFAIYSMLIWTFKLGFCIAPVIRFLSNSRFFGLRGGCTLRSMGGH